MGLSKKDARTREQKEKAAKGIKVRPAVAALSSSSSPHQPHPLALLIRWRPRREAYRRRPQSPQSSAPSAERRSSRRCPSASAS